MSITLTVILMSVKWVKLTWLLYENFALFKYLLIFILCKKLYPRKILVIFKSLKNFILGMKSILKVLGKSTELTHGLLLFHSMWSRGGQTCKILINPFPRNSSQENTRVSWTLTFQDQALIEHQKHARFPGKQALNEYCTLLMLGTIAASVSTQKNPNN